MSAAIKKLHGDAWTHELRPLYDKRGLASLLLTRFSDLDSIQTILQFPVYHLQLELSDPARIEELQFAVPTIVKGLSSQLEFLQIDYLAETTGRRTDRLRNVLPQSGAMFKHMPLLNEVVFGRINFGNVHMKAICGNSLLASIDLRDCDVTKSIATSLTTCARLEYLLVRHCRAIAPTLEEWFRSMLPRPKVVRIR